jgi:hypothetical protein
MPSPQLISSLRENLEDLFALANMFPAIRNMTVGELESHVSNGSNVSNGVMRHGGRSSVVRTHAAPKKTGKRGRLKRRTEVDIQKTLDQIVTVLHKNRDGLRSEQIQEALGLDKRELPAPLAIGLQRGAIRKTGQKRATTYFAGSAKKRAPAPRRTGGKKK